MKAKMLRMFLGLLGCCIAFAGSAQTPTLIDIPYEDWQQGVPHVEAMIMAQMPVYAADEMMPDVCDMPFDELHRVVLSNSLPENGICQGLTANLDCDGSIEVWRESCYASNEWCLSPGNETGLPAAYFLPGRGCTAPFMEEDALQVEVTPGDKILTITDLTISGVRPYFFDCEKLSENKLESIEVTIYDASGTIVTQANSSIPVPPSVGEDLEEYQYQLTHPITLIPGAGPITIRLTQCGGWPGDTDWITVFGWDEVTVNGYCGCGICGDMSWDPLSALDFNMVDQVQPYWLALRDQCDQQLMLEQTSVRLMAQSASQACLNCDDFCPVNGDLFIISVLGDTLYSHDTLYLTGCLGLIPSPEDFLQPIPGMTQMLTYDQFIGHNLRLLRWKWWGGGCPDLFFRLYVVYDQTCDNFCPDQSDLYIENDAGVRLFHEDTLFLTDCLDLIPTPDDFQTPIPGMTQMLTYDEFINPTTRLLRWKWWGGNCPDVFFRLYVVYPINCQDFCPDPDDLFVITTAGDTLYSHDTLYLSYCLELIPSPEDFLQPIPGMTQMQTYDEYLDISTRLLRWKWWGGNCPDLFFRLYVVYCPPNGGGAGQSMAGSDPGLPAPEKGTFQVWPNPFRDMLTVRVTEESTLRLYSSQGTLIMSWTAGPADQELSVQHLSPGIYILIDEHGQSRKVIKNH